MKKKLLDAIKKFNLNLSGKIVLTEAATGNYVVTPVIAAISGANVIAFTRNTKYGTIEDVRKQTLDLAKEFNVNEKITIVTKWEQIPFSKFDIVTNTGLLRPINKLLISKLKNSCVIPLMWEPWEFRPEELDIEACAEKGIKVYGTNESDSRLKTMDYIGYIALYWLLENKISPFSGNILVLGSEKFVHPIKNILQKNSYKFDVITAYDKHPNVEQYSCFIIAEYESDIEVIGGTTAFINKKDIDKQLVIHISGNIELKEYSNCMPKSPKSFPYMSFTTDFIDNKAVIDLHTAGFKVAEGMLKANTMSLNPLDYKKFMESNYPALAFNKKKYW